MSSKDFVGSPAESVSKDALEGGEQLEDVHLEKAGADIIAAHNTQALIDGAAQERSLSTFHAVRTYWRIFGWCMFMSFGAVLTGYDDQVAGNVLSVPAFREDFGDWISNQWVLSAAWQSGFNSAVQIGQMFGSLTQGVVSDKLGRRVTILLASILSTASVFIQFFTPPHTQAMLLIGRLLNGYAVGIYVSNASNYCSEWSPVALRGVTTGSVNFWVAIGQFLANVIIQGTGVWTTSWSYRVPFALQWFFPLVMFTGLLLGAPESPWFLIRKGKDEQALAIIAKYAKDTPMDPELRFRQIKETIEIEDRESAQVSYRDLFRGTNKRRTMIAAMVFVLQQSVGVSFVLGFSTYFFELSGFATANAFKLSVGTSSLALIGNIIGIWSVNALGRRFLYFWGMVACVIDNLLVGFLSLPGNQSTNWAMSVFTMLYMLVYQAGIGPLAYVIYAEVSSARLRSKTVGFGILTNAFCGLIVKIVNPYLVNPNEADLGGKVGFIYGGLGAFGVVWAYFFVPETTGRTVDELDELFELEIPPRKFKGYRIENRDTP